MKTFFVTYAWTREDGISGYGSTSLTADGRLTVALLNDAAEKIRKREGYMGVVIVFFSEVGA